MANIPKVNGTFELEVNDATQSYEDTLYTDNKNISGNIHIHITARTGVASITAQTLNSGTTTLNGTTLSVQAVVTPNVSPGYVNSGNSGVVTIKGTVPTEAKTATPTTLTQTITPSSGKLLSSVVVEAVPEIETESKIVKSTLATATVTPTAGKYITEVIVQPIALTAKIATPTTAQDIVVAPIDADGLSQVTVKSITIGSLQAPATTTTLATLGVSITPSTSTQYINYIGENSSAGGYTTNRYVKVNPIPADYVIPSGTLEVTSGGTKNCRTYASVSIRYAAGMSTSITGTTAYLLGSFQNAGTGASFIRPYTTGWWWDSASYFRINPIRLDYWGRTNGTGTSTTYTVKLNKGEAAIALNDGMYVYWSTTASTGSTSSRRFTLSGGGWIYWYNNYWYYCNYNEESGTSFTSGDSTGVVYLRSTSGNYLRRITRAGYAP